MSRFGHWVALTSGFTVLFAAVWLVHLLGPRSFLPTAKGAATGADVLVAAPVSESPQHLADLRSTERYFNATVGDEGVTVGARAAGRNIGIRPDMDERRQGYVEFNLGGGYRLLNTTAGISDRSPAGTRQRLEIYRDGKLLTSTVVAKGVEQPIIDLDVSGVNQLRFVASNSQGPSAAGGVDPEAVFVDPVLR